MIPFFISMELKTKKIANREKEQARRIKEEYDALVKDSALTELPEILRDQIKADKHPHFILNSLQELIDLGFTRTGHSDKGGKIIWTNQLCEVLDSLNINYESGNDAPRGGGNGEFVKIQRAELEDRLEYINEILSIY